VYLTFVTESEPSAKDRLIGKDYKRRSVYFTFVMESELLAIKLLNAINSATKCKVMLRSSARECCHLRRSPKGVQISSTPEAWGAAAAVRSGSGRSQALGSKVRFADIHVSHLSS
jgi:hypothetical protein